MAMSDLSFLYLARPYPWNVGNVWFLFPALYACIVHDVYVCVCVFAFLWVIVHFVL